MHMRKFLLSLLVVAFTLPVSAGIRQKKADKDTDQFRYEIECAGNAIQGTYLVKVWSYSKKASVAENQCRKNAVHGVIFKGYGGGQGCVSQRPLANQPGVETQYKEYFDSFFANGAIVLGIVAIVIDLAAGLLYLGYLNRARKMLA